MSTLVNRESAEPVYRGWAAIVHAVLTVSTRRDWRHRERVPREGGVLIVANHISHFDPLVLGEYLIYGAGRWPRYLGKEELWHAPVVGWLARNCGQIPVRRDAGDGGSGLAAAEQALHDGLAVTVYPEGTITADPDGWPMVARSGAARLALATRCPVVPIGQTGADLVIPGKRMHVPRLFPPKPITITCGEPVALDDLYAAYHPDGAGDGVSPAVARASHEAIVEAGARIMDAITALTEEVRARPAPSGRYDMRLGRRVPRPIPPMWLDGARPLG